MITWRKKERGKESPTKGKKRYFNEETMRYYYA
nr:MAG TPA: hypothetical protein [Caudoviricetes sp.]